LRIDPIGGVPRYESGFDRPDHEAVSRVAAPERAVAVEDGTLRVCSDNGAVEFFASILFGWGRVQRGQGKYSSTFILSDERVFCTAGNVKRW
jgi:hypothetical protein